MSSRESQNRCAGNSIRYYCFRRAGRRPSHRKIGAKTRAFVFVVEERTGVFVMNNVMNNVRQSQTLRFLAIGGVAASLLLARTPAAQSATLTWLGTLGTSWSTTSGGTSNWSGNAVPANGDTLVFTGGSNLNTSNDLSGLTLSGTAAGSGGYSLNINSNSTINLGGNQLTINQGSTHEISLRGTGTHTISAPIAMRDAGFSIQFNGTKTISGVLSGTKNAEVQEVVLAADTDTDRLILSGLNTFDVYDTVIYGGIIQVNTLGNANQASSLGINPYIRAGVDARTATIDYVGSGNSTNRQIRIGDYGAAGATGGVTLLSNGSGALVFTSGTLQNYGPGYDTLANRILTLGGTNANGNEIQSVITNNKSTGGGTGFSDTAGTIGITKTGAGRWILSGNNTYTGSNTVSAGLLIAGHANALGSTFAGTTVSSGAALGLQGNITTAAEALSITGTGAAGGGALRNVSGVNTYAGAVTLAGDARIGADAGSLTVSGAITGTNQVLTVVGSGTVTLSNAANTFGSGLTGNNPGLFVRGGNLRNGVANAVNSNLMVTVESGTWDLAGYDQTVRTTFSGSVELRAPRR
ncbi:MAG: hypothetical protein EBR28_11275 [Planctomycetia bacterium]|nr:hypothetical protein [Planctomycetia bacterium]